MPPKSREQKERKRLLHKRRLEEKRLEEEEQRRRAEHVDDGGDGDDGDRKLPASSAGTAGTSTETQQQPQQRRRHGQECGGPIATLVGMPDDALCHVLSYLPARDLGAASLTGRRLNRSLAHCRVRHLLARIGPPGTDCDGDDDGAGGGGVHMRLCADEAEARELLEKSLGGGDTGRIVSRKSRRGGSDAGADEYPAYARFVEEAVCGHTVMSYGGRNRAVLPKCVGGRIVSCSPEHTLCRVGGGGRAGGGGSGCASWGVGKRGQLGHGNREDEARPRPLLGGIGYKVRIVQVSAGGGLVRVAHSLLLTDTGRVLSFGTAQYGQLGHGYGSGKTLADETRPRYVDALSRHRVICVSAGELHSAAVTDDGDVYTWGDGFCGQLGHGDKRPRLLPKQVESGGLDDECVSVVSCGNRHTLCVTEDDGALFSFGLGHFGALGRAYTPFDYDADGVAGAVDVEDLRPALPGGVPAGGGGGGGAAAAAVAMVLPPMNPLLPVEQRRNGGGVGGGSGQRGAGGDPGDSLEGRISAETLAHLDLLANLTLDDTSDQCIPMVVDSLEGIRIVGSSAGHRHSLVLDEHGGLFSFGSGLSGALGHGDKERQEHPMKIMTFVHDNVRIAQFSAGVDMSMAVSTDGTLYAWGKSHGGRIGLGTSCGDVTLPRRVPMSVRSVDVECGYVHSAVVAADGTVHVCGGVGTDGDDDGQKDANESDAGKPIRLDDFNVWHHTPEPKAVVSKERWRKYGKYELQGRSKVLSEAERWGT